MDEPKIAWRKTERAKELRRQSDERRRDKINEYARVYQKTETSKEKKREYYQRNKELLKQKVLDRYHRQRKELLELREMKNKMSS